MIPRPAWPLEPAPPIGFSAPVTMQRYRMRRDAGGWTVFDVWTGQAVVIACRRQSCLPRRDAAKLALMLNDQVGRGLRVVLQ